MSEVGGGIQPGNALQEACTRREGVRYAGAPRGGMFFFFCCCCAVVPLLGVGLAVAVAVAMAVALWWPWWCPCGRGAPAGGFARGRVLSHHGWLRIAAFRGRCAQGGRGGCCTGGGKREAGFCVDRCQPVAGL